MKLSYSMLVLALIAVSTALNSSDSDADADTHSSGSCEQRQTCKDCVVQKSCYWTTLFNGTLVCVANLAEMGLRYMSVATTRLDCPRPKIKSLFPEKEISAELDQVNSSIETTQLLLNKKKTMITLTILNSIILALQTVQHDLTNLYYNNFTSMTANNALTLEQYKEEDGILFEDLKSLETQFANGLIAVKNYDEKCDAAGKQLKLTHDSFRNILTD